MESYSFKLYSIQLKWILLFIITCRKFRSPKTDEDEVFDQNFDRESISGMKKVYETVLQEKWDVGPRARIYFHLSDPNWSKLVWLEYLMSAEVVEKHIFPTNIVSWSFLMPGIDSRSKFRSKKTSSSVFGDLNFGYVLLLDFIPFDRANQELQVQNAFLDESLELKSKLEEAEMWASKVSTFLRISFFLYAHIRDNRCENFAKYAKTSKL